MTQQHLLRKFWRKGIAAGVGLVIVAGCGESPATSSSDEKSEVKGIVTYQGKPVKKGTISFDPSNSNRRMASPTTSPIGTDGSYSVSTLIGRNTISFELPGIATTANRLNYSRANYEVKSGENSYNIELPLP